MGNIVLQRAGSIATVTLSNPDKLNALDVAMWRELASTFRTLSQDESLRCVLVRGEGGTFAAGADIAEFPALRHNAQHGQRYHEELVSPALNAIVECIHPTIASIDGACAGGGLEIACASDLRIGAPTARFGVPIKRLGFALAPAEMRDLVQLVGIATTLEILLEGRMLSATEAKDKGLLHRIADDVYAEAQATAQRIAEGAPLAARMNKKLARRLAPLPEALSPSEILDAYALLDSTDYREGVAAFLGNRKPAFTGK